MSVATSPARPASCSGKYLTVMLDGEAYGIAVLKVTEIIRHRQITPMPQMPPHVRGVIDLRGRIIPIADLRIKFGLRAESTERTCIVVVQVRPSGKGLIQLGLVVDSVEDVVNLTDADIEPPPTFGHQIETRYLLGMAKTAGHVKTLLDIEYLFGAGDIEAIAATDRSRSPAPATQIPNTFNF